MTDYTETAKGVGIFFASFFLGYIIAYAIPPVLGWMTNETIVQIGQFAVILLWVLGMIVIPNYFILRGIQTQGEGSPFLNIIISLLLVIFTLIFLFKAHFFITGMASIIEESLLLAIYWIGVLTTLTFAFFVTPIATIIQSLGGRN